RKVRPGLRTAEPCRVDATLAVDPPVVRGTAHREVDDVAGEGVLQSGELLRRAPLVPRELTQEASGASTNGGGLCGEQCGACVRQGAPLMSHSRGAHGPSTGPREYSS